MTEGPYTQAMHRGDCPLCQGSGRMGEFVLTIRDGELIQPGDPCEMCFGSGRWPPPDQRPDWCPTLGDLCADCGLRWDCAYELDEPPEPRRPIQNIPLPPFPPPRPVPRPPEIIWLPGDKPDDAA